jgi:hypothetical protein
MRVYRVLVAMDPGTPDRWATLIAPGCDLPEATAAARNRFGAARVLEVRERFYPHPAPDLGQTRSGVSPMPALPGPQPHPASA